METNEQNDYTELDLRELAGILKERMGMIALITLFAVAISGVVSYYVLTPQYEASAEILVNQNPTEAQYSSGDIRTNLELINTYNVVMTSPRVLDKVISEYNLDKTYNELNNQISVTNVSDSQVMEITVTDPSLEQAVYMANGIAHTFQTEIQNIMQVDNVHIMAEAQLSESPSPVQPRPALNMAIAFVVGLMTAVGLAFLLEYLDNTIKSEEDIDKTLGLPVLGTIGQIDAKTERKIRTRTKRKVGGEPVDI